MKRGLVRLCAAKQSSIGDSGEQFLIFCSREGRLNPLLFSLPVRERKGVEREKKEERERQRERERERERVSGGTDREETVYVREKERGSES